MEPLNSAPLATLYGTFEDETPTVEGFRDKENFPLESQNVKSSNLIDNQIRTSAEMVGNDIESEAEPSSLRKNSSIEKQGQPGSKP